MGLAGGVRKQAASLIGAYGRAVLDVADAVAGQAQWRPANPRAAVSPAPRSAAAEPAPVEASAADLRTLRAAALDSTLAAAADPSRTAAERFASRVTGVSDWTAGRLLADTERLRHAAAEIARSSVGGPDSPAPRRVFAASLRRQFPWADDATVHALWDHSVLLAHRATTAVRDDAEDTEAQRGVLGGLLGRLRRNS